MKSLFIGYMLFIGIFILWAIATIIMLYNKTGDNTNGKNTNT